MLIFQQLFYTLFPCSTAGNGGGGGVMYTNSPMGGQQTPRGHLVAPPGTNSMSPQLHPNHMGPSPGGPGPMVPGAPHMPGGPHQNNHMYHHPHQQPQQPPPYLGGGGPMEDHSRVPVNDHFVQNPYQQQPYQVSVEIFSVFSNAATHNIPTLPYSPWRKKYVKPHLKVINLQSEVPKGVSIL